MSGNNLICEAKMKYSVNQIIHRMTPVCNIHRTRTLLAVYVVTILRTRGVSYASARTYQQRRRSAALQRNTCADPESLPEGVQL